LKRDLCYSKLYYTSYRSE